MAGRDASIWSNRFSCFGFGNSLEQEETTHVPAWREARFSPLSCVRFMLEAFHAKKILL